GAVSLAVIRVVIGVGAVRVALRRRGLPAADQCQAAEPGNRAGEQDWPNTLFIEHEWDPFLEPPFLPPTTHRYTHPLHYFRMKPFSSKARRDPGPEIRPDGRDKRPASLLRSAHQLGDEVVEAVAAFDPAGDTLADNGAGPAEARDGRLAPRRVVRMNRARRRAGLDLGAELDKRLEEARLRRIAIVILAAELHQARRVFRAGRFTRQHAERVQYPAHAAFGDPQRGRRHLPAARQLGAHMADASAGRRRG